MHVRTIVEIDGCLWKNRRFFNVSLRFFDFYDRVCIYIYTYICLPFMIDTLMTRLMK